MSDSGGTSTFSMCSSSRAPGSGFFLRLYCRFGFLSEPGSMGCPISSYLIFGLGPRFLGAFGSESFSAGIFLGCSFGFSYMYIWAVGILASGQASTMTGTYAGQFCMQGFLKLEWPQWK